MSRTSENRIVALHFSAAQARKFMMKSIDPELEYDDDTTSDSSELGTDSGILYRGTSNQYDIWCIWSATELPETGNPV